MRDKQTKDRDKQFCQMNKILTKMTIDTNLDNGYGFRTMILKRWTEKSKWIQTS